MGEGADQPRLTGLEKRPAKGWLTREEKKLGSFLVDKDEMGGRANKLHCVDEAGINIIHHLRPEPSSLLFGADGTHCALWYRGLNA